MPEENWLSTELAPVPYWCGVVDKYNALIEEMVKDYEYAFEHKKVMTCRYLLNDLGKLSRERNNVMLGFLPDGKPRPA